MRVITQGGIAFNFTMTSGKKSCRLNFEAEVLRTMESMCFVYKKLIYLQIKKYDNKEEVNISNRFEVSQDLNLSEEPQESEILSEKWLNTLTPRYLKLYEQYSM